MFWVDHEPTHFHAIYGEHDAQILISTGEVLGGSLPRRAQRLVAEWARLVEAQPQAEAAQDLDRRDMD